MLLKDGLLYILKSGEDIASLDFKDWLFSDGVFGENVQADNLRKWIRYAAVEYGDADQVLKQKEEGGGIWAALKWDCWDIKYIDCIYSFKTYFNAFLRFYLDGNMESYGYILDHYDRIFSQNQKEKFAEKNEIDALWLAELFQELNRFALNTHTIGNYMPCPDKEYNSIKGFGSGYQYFQDRLDLLYEELCHGQRDYAELNEKREFYKEWLDQNKGTLQIADFLKKPVTRSFCALRGRCWVMNSSSDIEMYCGYLKEINRRIENRGFILEEKLKQELRI